MLMKTFFSIFFIAYSSTFKSIVNLEVIFLHGVFFPGGYPLDLADLRSFTQNIINIYGRLFINKYQCM